MKKFYGIALLALAILGSCKKKVDFDEKVINQICPAKINGLDPILADDLYSSVQVAKIYEGLYQYAYLERPYKVIPAIAKTLPQVSEDGLVYTIELKRGILFQDNACFENNKGREVVADDFKYAFLRLANPKIQSSGWGLIAEKIKGLDEWRERNINSEDVNYNDEVEGLKVLGKYQLQITLTRPFPQFLYGLTQSYLYAVPREAVEHYGKDFINNPVGSGPFMTGEFKRSNKIIYTKNPTYREVYYPSEGEPEDKANGLLDDAGKKLPLVDKIVVNIQTESQPAWLSFEKGKVDYYSIPKDYYDQVVTPGKDITDKYAKKGISLATSPSLDITYIAFNNEDPLFKDNPKLRRALSMAYNIEEVEELFYNNRTTKAQSIIPPGIAGYDEGYTNPYREYNIEKAKELLAEAGYPNGKGLPVIQYESVASTTSRQMGEYLTKQMEQIGVRMQINYNDWNDLQNKTKTKQAQMFGMAWGADYPDAENFLQLLYGPNESPGYNNSNYHNATYDSLFRKASRMQDSPERTALYKQLNKMIAEDMPIIFGVHRMSFIVKHAWFKNHKIHEFPQGMEKYYNIDLEAKKEYLPKL